MTYDDERRAPYGPALRVGALAGLGYAGGRAIPAAILRVRKGKWLAETKVKGGAKGQRKFVERFKRRMKMKNVRSKYGLEGTPIAGRAAKRMGRYGIRGLVGGALLGAGLERLISNGRRRRAAELLEGR